MLISLYQVGLSIIQFIAEGINPLIEKEVVRVWPGPEHLGSWRLVPTTFHSLLITHYLPLITYYLFPTSYHLLPTSCYVPATTYYLLLTLPTGYHIIKRLEM